ncbi:alpha/beta fold hydrolase [Larkinella sp. VNQ87]|uniref:alpha/beta fold hydrolase n=1 Tax=Larkinella sp. VNQ87 TaxID=3400921 RepID=UPI003C03F99F
MKPYRESRFRYPTEAAVFLEEWNQQIERLNGFSYERLNLPTSFGTTRVWAANEHLHSAPTVVFFPGARTCGLFWDLDNALQPFRKHYRYYIVDVNGQPSLSEGGCPRVKTDDYGHWATEVLDGLGIQKTAIAGASLGGLICLKLCLTSPERIEKAVLLNPAGIQPFSTSLHNLYNNLLSILWPTPANLDRFLNSAVFCPPHHTLPPAYRKLVCSYLLYILKNHRFRGDYPAPLSKTEFHRLTTDIELIVGENDLLFPPRETIRLAEKNIPSLQSSLVLPKTAHGIETSKVAIMALWESMESIKRASYEYVC